MNSPWGNTQTNRKLTEGVHWVSTASHGGLMVRRDVAEAALSPKARELAHPGYCRDNYFDYLCFEEDCSWAIAFYERPEWERNLLDEKRTKAELREEARKTIEQWYPEYFGQKSRRQIEQEFYENAIVNNLHPIRAAVGCPDGSVFVWASVPNCQRWQQTERRAYLNPGTYKMPPFPNSGTVSDRMYLEDYERAGEVLRTTTEEYPASVYDAKRA